MKRMMDKKLLEILACPYCHAEVELVNSAKIKCCQCHRCYPIKDGIPIMLVEEAKIEE
jgi:hypothetical protein